MQKQIIYIGNKLADKGFTPTNIDTLAPLLQAEGFNVICASTKKNPVLRLVDMIFTIISRRKTTGIVLIDTYSTAAFYFAAICGGISYALRIPYIPILHGGNLPQRIVSSPRLAKLYFGRSYNNVVISEYLNSAVLKYGYKSVLIPNNIDIRQYKFRYRKTALPTLIWVRSFHEIYNPQMAIEVLALVHKKIPTIQMIMIGPDKDGTAQKCKELAIRLGVSELIEFPGKLPKKEWLERAADFDIFLNTTHFDNLPVSIIEAFALGLPVVSTNVGGIPFLITDSLNGLLVQDNDREEMAEKVLLLLNNPDLVSSLSTNARKSAEQFDWNSIKSAWETLLRPLTDAKA